MQMVGQINKLIGIKDEIKIGTIPCFGLGAQITPPLIFEFFAKIREGLVFLFFEF